MEERTLSGNNDSHYTERLALRKSLLALTSGVDVIGETTTKLQQLLPTLSYIPSLQHELEKLKIQLLQPQLLLQLSKQKNASRRASSSFNLTVSPVSSIFVKLDTVVAATQALQSKLATRYKNEIEYTYATQISVLLEKIIKEYQSFRQQFSAASPEEKIRLSTPPVRMRGHGIGFYYLNVAAVHRLSDALKENPGAKTNVYGTHTVIKVYDIFLKIRPEAPAVEYAVDALNKILTSQGSAPSELLIIEDETTICPVQASLAVMGDNFRDLIEQHPIAVEQQIDTYNYSSQILMTMLVQPLDAKHDNYIAKHENLTRIKLIGIDNDAAFGYPICLDISPLETIEHVVELKSILYCMSQMHNEIDPQFRQDFLAQNPTLIMIYWLKVLLIQEEKYAQYLHVLSSGELKKVGIPMRFLPGIVIRLYKTLLSIREILLQQPQITHHELLATIDPIIAIFYAHVREESSSLLKRMHYIYSYRPPLERVLKLDAFQQAQLQQYSKQAKSICQDRTQSIQAACGEWVNQLDFSMLGDATLQDEILLQIMSHFPFITTLTLKNCSSLTDERLRQVAHAFSKLETLNLHGCTSLQGDGLHAVLSQHPDIAIQLQGFQTISSENLLTVSRHCKNFKLILNNEKTYVVNSGNMDLFAAALEFQQANLLEFLLAYGVNFLHLAVKNKALTVVEQLITYGADVNLKIGEFGKTPLDIALEEDEPIAEIIALLFKTGANHCKNITRAIQIGCDYLKKVTEKNDTLREKLFLLARNYNKLNSELLPLLIPNNCSSLDLSITENRFAHFQLTPAFIAALHACTPQLERIDITSIHIVEETLKLLVDNKVNTVVMNSSQAIACKLMTIETLYCINELKYKNATIEISELEISKINFSSYPALAKLSTALAVNKTIKSISMWRCEITNDEMRELASGIRNNIALKQIKFFRNQFKKGAIAGFVEMLIGHATINFLRFESNNVNAEEAEHFANLIKHNHVLVELLLTDNPITDAGIELLAAALAKNHTLKSLSLKETRCGSRGVKMLAKALITNKTLTWLSILDNDIKDIELQQFLDAFTYNTTLTQLIYRPQSQVSAQNLALLQWQRTKDEEKNLKQILKIKLHSRTATSLPAISPEQQLITTLQARVALLEAKLQAVYQGTSTLPADTSYNPRFLTGNNAATVSNSTATIALLDGPTFRQ